MSFHGRQRSARRGMFAVGHRVVDARKKNRGAASHRSRDLGGVLGIGVLVVGLALGAVTARIRNMHQQQATDAASATPVPVTPDVAWDDAWPHLMLTGIPARPFDRIRAAYAFAARRPDVMQSLPCFCGCARQGHRSNEACYVKGRSATGEPRWTDHAITCGMCIDITDDAIIMTNKQQSADAIRQAIETKYRVR